MVRIKQRYILGEIVLAKNDIVDLVVLNQKAIQDNFKDAVKDCYGDLGTATLSSNFLSNWQPLQPRT